MYIYSYPRPAVHCDTDDELYNYMHSCKPMKEKATGDTFPSVSLGVLKLSANLQ